jgi:CarD family transcriptional regulator, regulator of rRNA transcription
VWRPHGYDVVVRLSVGDMVVYGTHGTGRVVARTKMAVSGVKHDAVVVELGEGLTVTLPVDRAQEQLRGLASEADIGRIQQALREDRTLSVDPWLTRRRETLAKLTGGDPVELAEIVGDGAQRERALRAAGKGTKLSPGEREIFVKARHLLSTEIARVRGLHETEVDGWIDDQLSRAG